MPPSSSTLSRLTSIPLSESRREDESSEALSYARVRMSYLFPVSREEKDLGEEVYTHIQHLLSKDITAVRMGALAGNAADVLELALRCSVGATTTKDEEAALELLRSLTSPANTLGASRAIRARAWALAAHMQYERRLVDNNPDSVDVDVLHRAAMSAEVACAQGFVCPGVLTVGMAVERMGLRRQADCKIPGVDTQRFAGLAALWKAVDRRKAEIQLADRKLENKLKKNPGAYICAAEGCGIEATHKAALLRCAGKCAMKGKPAYCSKECQKKDWGRHKPFCREGAPVDDYAASMRQTVIDESLLEPINLADTEKWGPRQEFIKSSIGPGVLHSTSNDSSRRKAEYRIKFPYLSGGQDTMVTSSTIDPRELKEIKAYVDAQFEERLHPRHPLVSPR